MSVALRGRRTVVVQDQAPEVRNNVRSNGAVSVHDGVPGDGVQLDDRSDTGYVDPAFDQLVAQV
ncbi:hypothetical protein ABT236_30615 [Streptomyces sp. NPDC001523]|uniref:hypothetical protein n=1 Tax=Streptomyces sp. NPDC001523 TaxID=3154383 RepID=UPI003322F8E5